MPAPFFILGSQGSGSTLLRLMLDAHPNLAVPSETGFMRLVTAHRWVPHWELGGDWHQRIGLTDEELDRRLGEFYGGMLSDFAGSQGKKRWGEKTPFHVWHVTDIRRLFPDAVFVAIVRHPLGAVGSMARRFDRPVPRATAHWLRTTRETVYRADEMGDRLALVRYEELARDPERVMRALLQWLGEPWSDAVLAHHRGARLKQSPRSVEGGTRPGDAVDAKRIERWRQWLDDETRATVLAETSEWARFLGYDAEPSGPLEPLSDGGGPLATGTDLTLRKRAFIGLDVSAPDRPRRDEPMLPKSRRNRTGRDAGRPESRAHQQARAVAERLPPRMQRGIREARRKRDERGDG